MLTPHCRAGKITLVKRRLVISVLLATALLASLSPVAGARVLATNSAFSIPPILSTAVVGLIRPSHLGFEITSKSGDPLDVRVTVKCFRRARHWHRFERKFTARPPIRRRVRLPVPRARGCVYSVSASRPAYKHKISIVLRGQAKQILRGS